MPREPRVWLVCYDIANDKRLRKVYRVMRGYGDHLQYSVFRCLISELQLTQLKGKLKGVIHATEDQVMFVPLGAEEGPSASGTFTIGVPLLHAERVVRIL